MSDIEKKIDREEKHIILAFFDILGTASRLLEGKFQEVYDFYDCMVKLCSDEWVPMAIPNRLARLKNEPAISELLGGMSSPLLVLSFPLKHAFFSDTFILWVEYDDFTDARIGGFLEKCSSIMCEAMKRGIPLRGVVSRGTAIMDEESQIFLGAPIAEAAKTESAQKWLGVTLAKSCAEFHSCDIATILPYTKHIKESAKDVLSPLALDWPRWWREHEQEDVNCLIDRMNTVDGFSEYYENTKAFVSYSCHGDEIWKQLYTQGHTR